MASVTASGTYSSGKKWLQLTSSGHHWDGFAQMISDKYFQLAWQPYTAPLIKQLLSLTSQL